MLTVPRHTEKAKPLGPLATWILSQSTSSTAAWQQGNGNFHQKSPFSSGISHCHVQLPEGTHKINCHFNGNYNIFIRWNKPCGCAILKMLHSSSWRSFEFLLDLSSVLPSSFCSRTPRTGQNSSSQLESIRFSLIPGFNNRSTGTINLSSATSSGWFQSMQKKSTQVNHPTKDGTVMFSCVTSTNSAILACGFVWKNRKVCLNKKNRAT